MALRSWMAWFCSVAPFLPALIILGAFAVRFDTWSVRSALGWSMPPHVAAGGHEAVAVAWRLSMMFAAYIAGPLWLLLTCIRRTELSWKRSMTQLGTFAAGWLFCWLLFVRWDLLNKSP
jgi:hypothetical protein